jgi:SPP1 gp7 family putative phage head morphogenesis protein
MQARNRLVGVGDDLWRRTRLQLLDGIGLGEDIDQLARRVREVLASTRVRAQTIARTEVVGAYNAGAFAQVQLLGEEAPVGKEWLATNDSRTRDTHRRANGQQVGLLDPFEVGDGRLKFPGDPDGPAEEVINCRCTVLWVFSDEQEQLVAVAAAGGLAAPSTFHLPGKHDQQSHAGGRRRSSDLSIPGVGSVDAYLEAHPRMEGEALFDWHGRLVNGLPPDVKHALLFEVREQYPEVDYIVEGAQRYRDQEGLPDPDVDISEVPAPLAKADLVAEKWEGMADGSDDPRVQAAYDEFKRQNERMFDFMTRPESEGGMGISVDFSPFSAGDPYPDAASQAADLRNNRHITLQSGLGGNHTLMTTPEYDRFRAVHDVFGHAGVGGGFDRHGEYQAYLEHSSMYEGAGRQAMASEYHGVNTAVWAGAPGSPGTGKAVLLPETLIPNPWDSEGNLVKAELDDLETFVLSEEQRTDLEVDEGTVEGIEYLIDELDLGYEFARRFDKSGFHDQDLAQEFGLAFHQRGKHDQQSHAGGRGRRSEGSAEVFKNLSADGLARTMLSDQDPIHTSDVQEAIDLLAQGKKVELDQPDRVATLLDELAKRAQAAVDAGEKAETYDLCDVSVKGTNLFCAEHKGLTRAQMPQLGGVPEPGSWADQNLTRDSRGEVDLAPAFREHLASMGIEMKRVKRPASHLKATQMELNGTKVAAIEDVVARGGLDPNRSIFTSNDDYVVDGHHRWAATVGHDLADSDLGDVEMTVEQIDAPILDVLALAYDFAVDRGLPPVSLTAGNPLTGQG